MRDRYALETLYLRLNRLHRLQLGHFDRERRARQRLDDYLHHVFVIKAVHSFV